MAKSIARIYKVPGSIPKKVHFNWASPVPFLRTNVLGGDTPETLLGPTLYGIGNRMARLSGAHILNLRYTGFRPDA